MNHKVIPEKYLALLSLIVWGALVLGLGLVRFDAYGLDEGAARALMLNWSVADNIVNPIFVLGAPDFRALMYLPIGLYWTGSILATKVFSIIIAFIGAFFLYRWTKRLDNSESALVATALYLVSPIVLTQIDSLGAGLYVILAFALGSWLDNAYRQTDRYFGAWYFLQLVWIAVVIGLHPIGLAYPLALIYRWYSTPHPQKKSRHIFVGIAISSFFSLAITMGWPSVDWFNNPLTSLSLSLDGSIVQSTEHINWVPGVILAFLASILLVTEINTIKSDVLCSMLAIAMVIGIVTGDATWATLVVTYAIYRGIPRLIAWNSRKEAGSFLGQKGATIVVAFVLSTFFMLQAKEHWRDIKLQVLTPEDELIENLSSIALDKDSAFRAASQWPGRTMIATRRDVLPLPPGFNSAEELYENAVKGVTHILFDPYDKNNVDLARNLAQLVSVTETLALNRDAALVRVKEHNVQLHIRPNNLGETSDTSTKESDASIADK
ncbi:MAG: hypothetical protein OEZ43_02130 [Gammaproteobacteria bacterium]|nr:hypothetical protein [Gammaproteobacteria bacterium]